MLTTKQKELLLIYYKEKVMNAKMIPYVWKDPFKMWNEREKTKMKTLLWPLFNAYIFALRLLEEVLQLSGFKREVLVEAHDSIEPKIKNKKEYLEVLESLEQEAKRLQS